jgi:hypothetical protein
MTDSVQVGRSAKVLAFPDNRPISNTKQAEREREIEFRLRILGTLIRNLRDAPYPGLLRDRGSIGEALEELIVKEATLYWIVRITKSTHGAVREKLWSDIERAVTDLEQIADSVMQPVSARRRAL